MRRGPAARQARVAAFSSSGKRANRKSAIRVSLLLTADAQCTNRLTCTDVRCRARLLNLPTLTIATVDCDLCVAS